MEDEKISLGGLCIDRNLHDLVETEIAPGTDVDPAHFWSGLEEIIHDLGPKNRALLDRRDELQGQIDDWHSSNGGRIEDCEAYRSHLEKIGYLLPE